MKRKELDRNNIKWNFLKSKPAWFIKLFHIVLFIIVIPVVPVIAMFSDESIQELIKDILEELTSEIVD